MEQKMTKKIVDALPLMPFFKRRSPATNEEIFDAESLLGTVFSEEYRAYLSAFGIVSVGERRLTGICDSNSRHVVFVTLKELIKSNAPMDWYVVERLSGNQGVVWQDRLGNIYRTGIDYSGEKIASSLLEYINSCV